MKKQLLLVYGTVFGLLLFLGITGSITNKVKSLQEVQSANISVTLTPTPTFTPTPTLNPTPTIKPTSKPTATPIPSIQSTNSGLSNDNYYTNTYGNQVHSPANSNSVPAGATAICGDGTYSFSQSRSGTCSHHGGVAQRL